MKVSICLLCGAGLVLSQSNARSASLLWVSRPVQGALPEAPTGYDNQTNGVVDQNTHVAIDEANFEEHFTISLGLGPLYNAQSCAECHQQPVTGGTSDITEVRAGHFDAQGEFVPATASVIDDAGSQVLIPNRSIINSRSICPGIDATQLGGDGNPFVHPSANTREVLPKTENVIGYRVTLNTLGDGFVEAVDDSVLIGLAQSQSAQTNGVIHGEAVMVPLLEAPGQSRVGRFGWKDQMASLLSFAAQAYLDEMGITNRLTPNDVTQVCKVTPDPEDTPSTTPDPVTGTNLANLDRFARFMRATRAPAVDPKLLATADAQAGQGLFTSVGCAICHVTTMVTAPAGTSINGGTFVVPPALGSTHFHPYGDFLLHNVGTGDGISQSGGKETQKKFRTAPLWGLRTRSRYMHDGRSLTVSAAIL
ncbi:MAG TPA: di-heme oxidoredictase family protein, partial [Blastocatellia bacterium]|nr:di-heme oxidoredictase family protein [Blastocatellia bacterium]